MKAELTTGSQNQSLNRRRVPKIHQVPLPGWGWQGSMVRPNLILHPGTKNCQVKPKSGFRQMRLLLEKKITATAGRETTLLQYDRRASTVGKMLNYPNETKTTPSFRQRETSLWEMIPRREGMLQWGVWCEEVTIAVGELLTMPKISASVSKIRWAFLF